MADNNQLNTAWLAELTNPHHDGTTQQIDDFVRNFETENAKVLEKVAAVHQCRLKEDEVWLKSQRDAVVPLLEAADKRQDGYIAAVRYIVTAHAGLPEGEATKQEAQQCAQVFKDFKFSTSEAYGAESDKIIQMQQNLQPHRSFLEQVGAWTFFTQAVGEAQQVRQYLGQRAQTKGEFVKGEMKAARRATDQAIADLYKTITAMMELVPSAELTTLATQLKGLELYAKQYYIASASSGSNNASGGGDNGGSTDGDEPTPTPGPTPDPIPDPTPDPSGGGDGGDGGDDEPDQ